MEGIQGKSIHEPETLGGRQNREEGMGRAAGGARGRTSEGSQVEQGCLLMFMVLYEEK